MLVLAVKLISLSCFVTKISNQSFNGVDVNELWFVLNGSDLTAGGAADGAGNQDSNHRCHSNERQQQPLTHAHYPAAQTGKTGPMLYVCSLFINAEKNIFRGNALNCYQVGLFGSNLI